MLDLVPVAFYVAGLLAQREGQAVLLSRPDRFSQFCCEGTVGATVVAGVLFVLLRAFRRNRATEDATPPDDKPPDES